MNKKLNQLNIVVLGGGSGTATLGAGFVDKNVNFTAVVAMTDNGGSSGILREELGVLPPGDARNCLLAMSKTDKAVIEALKYRFKKGIFKGHNTGNLLLSALEQTTDNFEKAIDVFSKLINVQGNVVPISLLNTSLILKTNNKAIVGENKISNTKIKEPLNIYLVPKAKINPKVLMAISHADVIVIGPGAFYTSLIPNLLFKKLRDAIKKSSALKFYVCNLTTNPRHTDNFAVQDFANLIEKYLNSPVDYVIYNNDFSAEQTLKNQLQKGREFVKFKQEKEQKDVEKSVKFNSKYIGVKLLNTNLRHPQKHDILDRPRLLHDGKKLADTILKQFYKHST